MAEKEKYDIVLKDVLGTFFPEKVGTWLSDNLTHLIKNVDYKDNLKKEIEKTYQTTKADGGYFLQINDVKKPIELGDITIDKFNLSITLDVPTDSQIKSPLSIFIADAPDQSYIAIPKIKAKLGFVKEVSIPAVGEIGTYSVVYEGKFEYYENFKFQFKDHQGNVTKGTTRSILNALQPTARTVSKRVRKKKNIKTKSRSTKKKKPFEVVVVDLVNRFIAKK